MKDNLNKINLEKLDLCDQDNAPLTRLTEDILYVFKKFKIDPEDKKILYLRTRSRRGLLGIQIGASGNNLEDYLVYRYDTIQKNDGFFVHVKTHAGKGVSEEANKINRFIANDVINCCDDLETIYAKEDPECECQIAKPIKSKKKNILKRLFNKE